MAGIRNEVPTTYGRKKGPRAAPEGCPSKGYPPCSGEKIGEILWWGFETRSQPPTGGRRDRGRPRRGALVRANPPAPIRIKEKSFGGDSKRGPNHLREEKKGFPDLKRYQTLETGFKYIGEMSEWSMVQSWKGCVLKGTGGSNPPLSEKKISETYVSGDSKRGPAVMGNS